MSFVILTCNIKMYGSFKCFFYSLILNVSGNIWSRFVNYEKDWDYGLRLRLHFFPKLNLSTIERQITTKLYNWFLQHKSILGKNGQKIMHCKRIMNHFLTFIDKVSIYEIVFETIFQEKVKLKNSLLCCTRVQP